MGLHELTIRNFRSFGEYILRPDPDAVTVLLSPNGTGKTSVLEAVYALATASSFRTSVAGDMITTGTDIAEAHGVIHSKDRRIQIDLTLRRGARATTKAMLVNGQRPTSRAVLSEVLPLTVFTPEGVDMVRQGPDHRRTFLTDLLSDVTPGAGDLVERFARVLHQRNAWLRAHQGGYVNAAQRGELDVWDQEFCVAAEVLVDARQRLVDDLNPLVSRIYRDLSNDDHTVSLRYEASWTGELTDALRRAWPDDIHRGHSTVGPQRDDVAVSLNDRDARRQASQGEQRSLALALRLAGHELVTTRRDAVPLLLLDDVFSELDPHRSDRLLRLLPKGQTLVTTASPLPDAMTPAVIVDVTEGR